MGHPMHTAAQPMEPKPPKDPAGQAKSYDDIRARIGKGATKLPK